MNLVYGWCIERVPDDKQEGWIAMLSAPLPNEPKRKPTPFVAEEEGASFMAAMAAHAARTGG